LVVDDTGGPPRLRADDGARVFDDDLRPVAPGSGVIGRLGKRGHIPLGYYRDPEKTAATFPVIDGERWSLPGDLAEVLDDGTILLLGRGSVSINTGGEKVFPEEVEQVVKAHPAVHDAIVVGLPDERFGQRVTAVVSARADVAWPGDDDVRAFCHERISGYKVPRRLVVVDEVPRLPTGKPDYQAARDLALAGTTE
jgi:acyl-CoA synthetase (AMP-forming)/AMP-acid ligase II